MKIKFNCEQCGKEKEIRTTEYEKRNHHFCCKECYNEYQRAKRKEMRDRGNKRLRGTSEYYKWRKEVFERDEYACQKCGESNYEGNNALLHAHHIKTFAEYPEGRYKVENGATLCLNCHITVHKQMKLMTGTPNGGKEWGED